MAASPTGPPVVRRYNIDLARAAGRAGVDEVLLDYVRRPDGPRSSMRFAGLTTSPEAAIVTFLAQMRKALGSTRTLLGASVFGVAATRPGEVAQDIPAIARHVDYIAPMVYPSHWGPGEYDVADPNAQPYEIVRRSLEDFAGQVRGTQARVVPWLQDFSLGRTYGPDEVRAQIRAARDAGMPEFILWDAGVRYTAGALDRDAPGDATRYAPPRAPGGMKGAHPDRGAREAHQRGMPRPPTRRVRQGRRTRPPCTRTSSVRSPCSCTTRSDRPRRGVRPDARRVPR